MDAAFGISLGTCSAAIAVSKAGKVEVLANHAGERATPTLVAYRENETLVGHSAKQALHRNSKNTTSHMTQLIGRDYSDLDAVTSSLMCDVVKSEEGGVCYCLEVEGKEKRVPVADALTHIFQSLYETAESFSSGTTKAAVIAVPANFTSEQRKAIRECAVSAGFQVMRIISEPAAVCLAHGIGQSTKDDKSFALVYNLGAHSLSLSLLQLTGGLYRTVKTSPTSSVGGGMLDTAIADLLAEEFKRQWKVDIRENQRARFKLLAAAESAKHALSTVQTTSIHMESLHEGTDFQYSLSRGRFEGMCSTIFRSCLEPLSSLLDEAGITKDQLDHVLLAGGSCKIPRLQQLLREEFPSSNLHTSPPPDVAIATGCALQASIMRERGRGRSEGEGGGVSGESDVGRVEVSCVPADLWIRARGCQASPVQLLSSLTPIPCQRTASLNIPLPSPQQDRLCLEVTERSPSGERDIAQVFVPVRGEEVLVRLTVVWTADNRVTIATKDTGSDWSCTFPLQCEVE